MKIPADCRLRPCSRNPCSRIPGSDPFTLVIYCTNLTSGGNSAPSQYILMSKDTVRPQKQLPPHLLRRWDTSAVYELQLLANAFNCVLVFLFSNSLCRFNLLCWSSTRQEPHSKNRIKKIDTRFNIFRVYQRDKGRKHSGGDKRCSETNSKVIIVIKCTTQPLEK